MPTARKSRKSKKPATRPVRRSLPVARKIAPPKTFSLNKSSSKSRGSRKSMVWATSQMSLVELQFIARSRGIPFGGLTRSALVKKLNYN